jgi:integrase/recombinase XerD
MKMKNIRQRMIEDMKLRGLTPGTQATYLEAVKVLARHYNRRPDEITQAQVRDFLLYLIDSKGYAKSTYKVYLYAIKFLYEKTLESDVDVHVRPEGFRSCASSPSRH